mmetsp:Transcript_29944/g.78949  ORF Transcript_29944/g.78949 Transcript_29944/m.78949 type:complete len:108 (-) Transcript_29944:8-331(-)
MTLRLVHVPSSDLSLHTSRRQSRSEASAVNSLMVTESKLIAIRLESSHIPKCLEDKIFPMSCMSGWVAIFLVVFLMRSAQSSQSWRQSIFHVFAYCDLGCCVCPTMT